MWTKREKMRGGFTLVEILTTMVIIGILLAVLLPALSHVSKSATTVKQKAQFHTLEMGLETFRTDTGDYPPSYFLFVAGASYSGSQRLAEAMVGRDGLGFHPESIYRPDGRNAANVEIYYPGISGAGFTDADRAANLATRKGPYLELESANAIKLSDIYLNYGQLVNSYVLVDSFNKVKNLTTGKKIGMPILYYKADRNKIGNSAVDTDWPNNTYNLDDSYGGGTGLLAFAPPFAAAGVAFHPMATDFTLFYNRIKNPNFTAPERPYRAESFILHSAGHDGLYGTVDDVFNFDEGK